MNKGFKGYIGGVGDAISQLGNASLYPLLNLMVAPGGHPFGNVDETMSSVMGKNIQSGTCLLCKYICKVLSLFDNQHCKDAIEVTPGDA